MNRAKIIITGTELHALLGLHPDVKLTAVIAEYDPVYIEIHVEGDRFPVSHFDEEAPIVKLWECRPIDESDLLRMAGVGSGRPPSYVQPAMAVNLCQVSDKD